MKIDRIRIVTILAPVLATFVVAIGSTAASADTALHKAGRGLAAITTPFLELPGNIAQTSQREGPIAGWTTGVARGIGMTVVRPLVGFYEIGSAPWAAPKNYEPILAPEYPWSYFGAGDSTAVAKRARDYRLAKDAKRDKASNVAKK